MDVELEGRLLAHRFMLAELVSRMDDPEVLDRVIASADRVDQVMPEAHELTKGMRAEIDEVLRRARRLRARKRV